MAEPVGGGHEIGGEDWHQGAALVVNDALHLHVHLPALRFVEHRPRLDEELAKVGRSREEINVSLRVDIDAVPTRESTEVYAALGIDELVISYNSGDADAQRRRLDETAAMLL